MLGMLVGMRDGLKSGMFSLNVLSELLDVAFEEFGFFLLHLFQDIPCPVESGCLVVAKLGRKGRGSSIIPSGRCLTSDMTFCRNVLSF